MNDDELEEQAWRFFLATVSVLIIGFALFMAAGCTTVGGVPPGYDADTTPGRDGGDWVGGK